MTDPKFTPVPSDHDIQNALKFDGIDEAEKTTGKSYKDDKQTEELALLFHVAGNKWKNDLLANCDDTNYTTSTTDFLRIAKGEGFEIIFEDTIPRFDRSGQKDFENHFYVLWSRGMILTMETYWPDNRAVNSAKLYADWAYNKVYSEKYLDTIAREDEWVNTVARPHDYSMDVYQNKPDFFDDDLKKALEFYRLNILGGLGCSQFLSSGNGRHGKEMTSPLHYPLYMDVRQGLRFRVNNLSQMNPYGSLLTEWLELPTSIMFGHGSLTQPTSDHYEFGTFKRLWKEYARLVLNRLPPDFDWLLSLFKREFD